MFASARAARQAGEEKLTQGRSLLLPSVNLNANTTKNDVTTTMRPVVPLPRLAAACRYNTPRLRRQSGATAVPRTELGGVQRVRIAGGNIAKRSIKLAEQDVILRSAQTYFDVLIAQDSVQLSAAQKTAISEQLEQAKRNFEVGTATVTDTYEAQARYDLIVAQELAAANNLEIKRRTLQQLVNANVSQLNELVPAFKLETPDPTDVQKWVDDVAARQLSRSPWLEAAYQLAEQEVARNRGGHLPTVDLVASYGSQHRDRRSIWRHRHAQHRRRRAAQHAAVPGRSDTVQMARSRSE